MSRRTEALESSEIGRALLACSGLYVVLLVLWNLTEGVQTI